MTDCDCVEGCQLADRFTPATRELMVFTKNPKRYFDLDAVREMPKPHSTKYNGGTHKAMRHSLTKGNSWGDDEAKQMFDNPVGAPPLDWWQIPSPKPLPVTEYQGDPMTATFYVGDAIETMNKLPENSVDLILTSPPFLALRSYLPADHPDKALEGGSQATPGAFIDWLVDVVEACDRVLAPHGSMCIELGDTYAASPNQRGPDNDGNLDKSRWLKGERENGAGRPASGGGTGWPLAKSLSLIPELFRLTLVYGTNPLTGRTTERWRLRNVVRWVRPNPPVGALGDKFRPATSELMVFCKSAKRYFDLDAVREPFKPETLARFADGREMHYDKAASAGRGGGWSTMPEGKITTAGAPPLDWWNIPPGGYEGAHYAVFPPELCVKPVKAMCPERVCKVCWEPSRRIAETTNAVGFGVYQSPGRDRDAYSAVRDINRVAPDRTERLTLGWTDCGHDDYRPGVVLDPFVGSGTTLMVATGHGRDAIGIDLDSRNYDLALERVGAFLLELGIVG